MITKLLQHSCKFCAVGFVDLKIEARGETEGGDAAIEKQRVGVWNEKGGMRFVVEHIGIHLLFFLLGDIGRIADYDVEPAIGKRAFAEDVTLGKMHGDTVGNCILTGNGEGILRDVHGIDIPVGMLPF